jgi:glyceraldehyde-3-phosphate dehydrogenase (NADP+)
MIPAVLYPVTSEMRVYHEEQFGPVIPIAPFDDVETVVQYGRDGDYGQQVSIFTSEEDAVTATSLVDLFSQIFGKININSQCGRSPDTLPFSGRRSSAMGIMSVKYALQEFSIPTAVVYKEMNENSVIVKAIQKGSTFLDSL